nr:MAG: hypothetical protein 2 [Wuhan Mosquito Virus 6]
MQKIIIAIILFISGRAESSKNHCFQLRNPNCVNETHHLHLSTHEDFWIVGPRTPVSICDKIDIGQIDKYKCEMGEKEIPCRMCIDHALATNMHVKTLKEIQERGRNCVQLEDEREDTEKVILASIVLSSMGVVANLVLSTLRLRKDFAVDHVILSTVNTLILFCIMLSTSLFTHFHLY